MITNRLGISPEDQKKISEQVAAAEAGTSGEIVPVIVGRSSSYSDISWRIAFGFAFLTALTLSQFHPNLTPTFYLSAEIPSLIIGLWLASFPTVQRLFLHQDRMVHEVNHRAVQAFFSHNLNSTPDRNGILILISVLERRVELIADVGIHSKISVGTWDEMVRNITEKFKDDKPVHGLSEAIASCGTLLKKHFPNSSRDSSSVQGELPNELCIED